MILTFIFVSGTQAIVQDVSARFGRTMGTALAVALAGVTGFACGDDETTLPVTTADGGTAGDGPSEGGSPTAARFIVHTSVDLPDDRINYFIPVSSLALDTPLDLTRALEVPGSARLYAPPFGGFFSVGSSESLSVTRYDLAADGSLTRSGVVSFANLGVTALQRQAAFISETKAYYFDTKNAQVVVWNPRDMVVVGTIDLSMIVRPGFDIGIIQENYPQRPGRLFTSVRWSANDESVLAETGLLVIDTAADRVLHHESDPRCTAATEVAELPSGDIYFGTSPDELGYNGQIRGKTRPGCHLRIKAGEERFDPGYVVQLSALVGNRAACDVIPTGKSNEVLFRVLDESKSPWTPENTEVAEADAWEYWRLDLGTGAATRATDLGVGQIFTPQYRVGDQVFLGLKIEVNDFTQLFQLSPEGTLLPGLKVKGVLRTIGTIRR
jgi:hypothetical protein